MRAALNAILAFIGAESLTDEEFDSLTIEDTDDDNETYLALNEILGERESISTDQTRLRYYFLAQGADLEEVDNGSSNIFLGVDLEN